MKLQQPQLTTHLATQLAPIYLISGDVPLLVIESCDAIRAQAKAKGFTEREVLHVDKSFNWDQLAESINTLSLFSEQRLIELHVPTGKMGAKGGKALRSYAEQAPEDRILLIISGKLDAASTKTKWHQAIDQAGVSIAVWPIEAPQLPQWLSQRMQQKGLTATPDALQLLAQRCEGNLLAAAQEIEKLFMLHGTAKLTIEDIENAVTVSSRFDIFQLADTALLGDTNRVTRVLQGLKGEGCEAILVLWALTREIRTLASMSQAIAKGQNPDQLMQQHRVWEKRKPIYRAALKRHKPQTWQRLLQKAGEIDAAVKGMRKANPWDELMSLALAVAGVRLFKGVNLRLDPLLCPPLDKHLPSLTY